MQHTVSSKTLIKASFAAVILAAIALVSLILPAEYNIDPTGVGKALGLTALAQPGSGTLFVSVSATELESETLQKPASTPQSDAAKLSEHSINVTVPAGRGVEYKFHMAQFAKMEYQWSTNTETATNNRSPSPLYFDLHGEPQGDTTGYFESYVIATSDEMKGSFTAPFAGSHGWYWKNTSAQAVTVQLKVSGDFTVIGLK
jgi:hypothetical protein